MSNGNLGYLYYKRYYELDNKEENYENKINKCNKNNYKKGKEKSLFNESNIKYINNTLLGYSLEIDIESYISFGQSFNLTTAYPGLLIGSGYDHNLKNSNDSFKLGFYFDYTTGLPMILGSSIKGVLRSAFPESETKDKELNDGKMEYIKALLGKITNANFTTDEIHQLRDEIFEGKYSENESIPIYKRDIFLGAEICGVKRESRKILGDDYITPHKEETKNPNPLKFLKVLPGVIFKFSFDLKDSQKITKEQKLVLFEKIILDLGVGSKTNIGYGSFTK